MDCATEVSWQENTCLNVKNTSKANKEGQKMKELVFSGSKRSIKKLSKVQQSIDKFLKKNPGNLNKRGHKTLRKLLSKRAKALSKATGMKVRSIFD